MSACSFLAERARSDLATHHTRVDALEGDLHERRDQLGARRDRLRQARTLLVDRRRELDGLRQSATADAAAVDLLERDLAEQRAVLVTTLDAILPIRPGLTPLSFTILEMKPPDASALGYIALLVDLLASYHHVPLQYAVSFRGSRSLVQDRNAKWYPLFEDGVEKYRAEYARFCLSKDVEQVRCTHRVMPDTAALSSEGPQHSGRATDLAQSRQLHARHVGRRTAEHQQRPRIAGVDGRHGLGRRRAALARDGRLALRFAAPPTQPRAIRQLSPHCHARSGKAAGLASLTVATCLSLQHSARSSARAMFDSLLADDTPAGLEQLRRAALRVGAPDDAVRLRLWRRLLALDDVRLDRTAWAADSKRRRTDYRELKSALLSRYLDSPTAEGDALLVAVANDAVRTQTALAFFAQPLARAPVDAVDQPVRWGAARSMG